MGEKKIKKEKKKTVSEQVNDGRKSQSHPYPSFLHISTNASITHNSNGQTSGDSREADAETGTHVNKAATKRREVFVESSDQRRQRQRQRLPGEGVGRARITHCRGGGERRRRRR